MNLACFLLQIVITLTLQRLHHQYTAYLNTLQEAELLHKNLFGNNSASCPYKPHYLTCTAALAVTLSLTGPEPPENEKNTGGKIITEIPEDEDKKHGNGTSDIPDEPGILPLNDWKPETDNIS